MKRSHIVTVSSLATLAALTAVAVHASPQDFRPLAVIGNVFLQDTTPGSVQAGHASISGTFRAGQVNVSQANPTTSPIVGNNTAVGAGSSVGGSFSAGQQSSAGIRGTATASTGATYGVYGESRSPSGSGVFGLATTLTGSNNGGYFISNSKNGNGVYGVATSATGINAGVTGRSNSSAGIGVFALASANSANTYGVYGSAIGYAVYANGNSGATGTKSFRIDHPSDPSNKYLLHYSTEGPEPQNVYNGTVTTDANGCAWVDLPDYYSEINRSPRYQLTVVDDSAGPGFVQVKVARKISGNRFMVMTSAPRVEVCWEVKAVRNDRWMRKYGAPVEVDKVGREKGTYQRPDLYGKPAEMGLDYRQ